MPRNQNGFIKLILIIIVIIAVLSYLGIKISSVVENSIFHENIAYAWNWCAKIWNAYLIGPASYLWNDFIIDLLWNPFVDALEKFKNGDRPDLMENAPAIQ